jgi:hypothetical protein
VGEAGLEESCRSSALGDHLAVDRDPYPACGAVDVDAVIRIARVSEHLLVLHEPLVELPPVEGRVSDEEGSRCDRLVVCPDRVGLEPVPHAKRAIRGHALVRTASLRIARFEQVVPNVILRHVVDGQVRRLVQELGAECVEDGLSGESAP